MLVKRANYTIFLIVFILAVTACTSVGVSTALPERKRHPIKESQSVENITVEQAQKEIIGTWIQEDDPSIKIVFNSFGGVKEYTDNVEDFSGNYVITTSCDSEVYDNGSGVGLYLKTKDMTESSWICQYINGINYDGSGILSLGNKDQYVNVLYIKQ